MGNTALPRPNKRHPSQEEVLEVERQLWQVVRALALIEETAIRISNGATHDKPQLLNILSEGIAGTAAVASEFVRRQQMALGGAE